MISKYAGMYELSCCLCGDGAGEEFEFFSEAVEYKKENGWGSREFRKCEWEDICPSCMEMS